MRQRIEALREPMPMPDFAFPVKLSWTAYQEQGVTLFPHHWHEHIEFLYFQSGQAVIECSSTPIVFHAGELAVVNSNELHYGVSASDEVTYYVFIVDVSLLHSHVVDAVETKFITPILQNKLVFQNRIVDDIEVSACLQALIEGIENKPIGYELSTKAELYKLLSILVRKYVAETTDQEAYQLRFKELERLAPVFQYIEAHYNEKLSVQQLADLVGLSRFHFSRIFKRITDKSIVEYCNLVRIQNAEKLLRQSTMSISEIADAIGFNDIYYFSRAFKAIKGKSPSMWRELQHT
ncbi:MAG: AraC family transcriptional regulator [Candidatus Cohnella colombiensis]|uniref:AraC family transcriptional regulator n=1 Tax=Candidatus Cohnella colombiensis TaxID=3121368 RepID=A0AA95EYU6_9BACL|nr:MAG: AraC family transcriptional regulator [Cohnella sp.]